jgi:hydroxyacylglutathione hydrolase
MNRQTMDLNKIVPIKIKNLFKNIFSIEHYESVFSYLIIGREKALLIDTGWGTVDLKSAILSITKLPLIIVNSHGHIDHIYGNYQFDQVFIRDEEMVLLKSDFTVEKRLNILRRTDA